jgi:hypothetical protein
MFQNLWDLPSLNWNVRIQPLLEYHCEFKLAAGTLSAPAAKEKNEVVRG